MGVYRDFHRRSLAERESFWAEEARLVHWQRPFDQVLDYSRPPFARWFVGGRTNLCHNAIDRHLAARADQKALAWISTEVNETRSYTYRQLFAEVNRVAAMMQDLGVKQGDRVIVYMPMIPEAAFAMLACARLGAIHSVVFGGFAAASLAARIDDAKPALMVTADGGSRMGKAVLYKSLVDEALKLARHPPRKVLLFNRGLDERLPVVAERDGDWKALAEEDRGVGGYAVALASSMKRIFCAEAGETMFTTSDIGWVVGHSYIVYAPLIAGVTTIMYEGVPIRPDAGVWWKIVQDYKVAVMFSAPTAIRVLKKQDPAYLAKYDLSTLKHLFLAGEPLDEPTHTWISGSLRR